MSKKCTGKMINHLILDDYILKRQFYSDKTSSHYILGYCSESIDTTFMYLCTASDSEQIPYSSTDVFERLTKKTNLQKAVLNY